MARKRNKELFNRDFRNGKPMFHDRRKRIEDDYFKTIKSLARASEQDRPKLSRVPYSSPPAPDDDVALQEALSKIGSRHDLREIQSIYIKRKRNLHG